MIDIRFERRRLSRRTALLFGLTVAFAAPTAQARQVLLVTNPGNGTVAAYNAVTGATVNANLISGLAANFSLGLDGNNHLLVANSYTRVSQYNATTGAMVNPNFITADFPIDVAADRNNNLYVATDGSSIPDRTVLQVNAATGVTINPGFVDTQAYSPKAPALDGNNHLFVAHTSLGQVSQYDATTGATLKFAFISGLSSPESIVVDALNHHLVSNFSNNTVGEYDATTGAVINAAFINGQGLNQPWGMALDGDNHLFVTNEGNNTIGEYDATTGATINPAFVTGQGLSSPHEMVFVAPVPEPSSLLMVAAAATGGVEMWRRRRN